MGVIAVAQITIRDTTDITVSAVAPSSPVVDQLWLDTSITPNLLKKWNGTEWEVVNESIRNSGNLLQDTSNEPTTATDTVIFKPEDIDVTKLDAEWITFRVHMDIVSGEWEPQLWAETQNALLGTTTLLGNFILGSSNNHIVFSGDIDDDGWSTITIRVPQTTDVPYYITAALVKTSQEGELIYDSPKLETGKTATPWGYADFETVGNGENLFADTSATPEDVTVETTIGSYYKNNAPINRMTFRAHIQTTGDWKVVLRAIQITSDETEVVIPITEVPVSTSDPWTQVTFDAPYDNVFIRAILVPNGTQSAQNAAHYSQVKLEYGTSATPWSEANDDAANRVAREVTQVLIGAQQKIDGIEGKITNLVTKTELDQFNEVIQQTYTRTEQTDEKIAYEVGNLQRNIRTNMTVDTAGLHLHQNEASQYEALLDSQSLSFVKRNDPTQKIASFGADGAWADRLRSNKTLSVGTDTEGWFDFSMLERGMAEKWRSGDSYVDADYPLCILRQPQNTFGDTQAILSIEVGPRTQNISYQWQRGYGSNWTDISGATTDELTVDLTVETNVALKYRCVVSGSSTETLISEEVCVGSVSAPAPFVFKMSFNALSILVSGASSYQWYNDGNAVSGATSQYFMPSVSGNYRCVVRAATGPYNASNAVYLEVS